MFEIFYQIDNRKRAQVSPEQNGSEEQEQWHIPPAQMEELPPGLIEDQI
jgi:hypothetical protein